MRGGSLYSPRKSSDTRLERVPSFLIIGHATRDLVGQGYKVGGTVFYASLTAQALGETVAVVTRAGPGLPVRETLAGVQVHLLPSTVTTTFRNEEYPSGRRRQLLTAVSEPIGPEDIPVTWLKTQTVMLAPVAGELSAKIVDLFPDPTVVVTPQGWLRRWDQQGLVSPKLWEEAERVLPKVQAAILSERDLSGDQGLIQRYASLAPILVVTAGARGATVFVRGESHQVPAFPTITVETTGAGDIFATAFAIWLSKGADPLEAARFAHCAAGLFIEGPGATGIPSLPRVQERLRQWKQLFGAS